MPNSIILGPANNTIYRQIAFLKSTPALRACVSGITFIIAGDFSNERNMQHACHLRESVRLELLDVRSDDEKEEGRVDGAGDNELEHH